MRLTHRRAAGLAAAALAATLGAAPVRAAEDPAVAPIKRLYAAFETVLRNGAGTVKARVDAVGPTLAETFDTAAMVPVAVGPKWKSFSPEQQGTLADAFGRYFVTTYANRLSQAAGGKFDIKPESEAKGGNRIVHTHVTSKDGDDSDVDYVVNARNRAQDVLLNGTVSELASMRASFAEPLKGGADGLLKFMRDRTESMLAAKASP